MQESRSLFQIVDQVIQSFVNRSNLTHVKFQNCVPHQLDHVNHNADLIIFLLVLIVESALKFVSKKGYVEIGANSKANNFEMWVRNNGKGIPTEMKDLIFDRQFLLANKQSQTDMGLSIVKRMLNYYGGKIWVECDAKSGNMFVFTVPNQD
ncbi:HAMP domain-containing histidine kinase [candidate division KSB1 bacterium]|nr:HAMP domain-containing histidine kinase [candidate division KSB1 bacterium]